MLHATAERVHLAASCQVGDVTMFRIYDLDGRIIDTVDDFAVALAILRGMRRAREVWSEAGVKLAWRGRDLEAVAVVGRDAGRAYEFHVGVA